MTQPLVDGLRAFVLPYLTDAEQLRLTGLLEEALNRADYAHLSEADRAETFLQCLGAALMFMRKLPLDWQARLAKTRH